MAVECEMNPIVQENTILTNAIKAFQNETGLAIDVLKHRERDSKLLDATIKINTPQKKHTFYAEIKNIDRYKNLFDLKNLKEKKGVPVILVAPYVTEKMAAECREAGLPFIDQAGNAYIHEPDLHIQIVGKKPEKNWRETKYRGLTAAGLRVIFALLTKPQTLVGTYRDIAKEADVALGVVGHVLKDLEARGLLLPEKMGERRILDLEKIIGEWVTHYPIKLRPKLHPRRYKAPNNDWWQKEGIDQQENVYFAGEAGAEKLTGYLKATGVTLYMAGDKDKFILANRLQPDLNGNVEILDVFWHEDTALNKNVIPLLVYADLIETQDPRNRETAKIIYDQYLAKI